MLSAAGTAVRTGRRLLGSAAASAAPSLLDSSLRYLATSPSTSYDRSISEGQSPQPFVREEAPPAAAAGMMKEPPSIAGGGGNEGPALLDAAFVAADQGQKQQRAMQEHDSWSVRGAGSAVAEGREHVQETDEGLDPNQYATTSYPPQSGNPLPQRGGGSSTPNEEERQSSDTGEQRPPLGCTTVEDTATEGEPVQAQRQQSYVEDSVRLVPPTEVPVEDTRVVKGGRGVQDDPALQSDA